MEDINLSSHHLHTNATLATLARFATPLVEGYGSLALPIRGETWIHWSGWWPHGCELITNKIVLMHNGFG